MDEGSVPYNKVKELIDFLPPQSISTTISDFKKESKRRANSRQDLFSDVRDKLAVISKQDEDLIELNDDLHAIEGKLSGGDVRGKVRAINSEIQLCDQTIKKSQTERDQLLIKREGLKKKPVELTQSAVTLHFLMTKIRRLKFIRLMQNESTRSCRQFMFQVKLKSAENSKRQSTKSSKPSMKAGCL